MAWRLHDCLLRGELDNTTRGRVTGKLWLHGREEPALLDLRGDCAPDLAGCVLTFTNRNTPVIEPLEGFSGIQKGWVGDITAARKARVHDLPMDEVLRLLKAGEPAPWHWANALYLEWFSERNGRMVIESADYDLTVTPPLWTLSPEDYVQSRDTAAAEQIAWLETLSPAGPGDFRVVNLDELAAEEEEEEEDDEEGEEWKRE